MNLPHGWHLAAACALGLVLTLALAAWLTPRRWWRRPTAANLSIAGAGTLGFAFLFAPLLASLSTERPTANAAPLAFAAMPPPPASPPSAALRYRVVEDLNLRAAKATAAPRLAVLPAGTVVTPAGGQSGKQDGDWLRVRANVKGKPVEGWTSSLWLRRVDER